jgi:hypothetical protein
LGHIPRLIHRLIHSVIHTVIHRVITREKCVGPLVHEGAGARQAYQDLVNATSDMACCRVGPGSPGQGAG